MLPITPSNFHYFVNKWNKKLNSYKDENQKNAYTKKIANKLEVFGNSDAENALIPYVKKWCNQINYKEVTADLLISGLKDLMNDDNKLML